MSEWRNRGRGHGVADGEFACVITTPRDLSEETHVLEQAGMYFGSVLDQDYTFSYLWVHNKPFAGMIVFLVGL